MFKKFYDWILTNIASWLVTIFMLTTIFVIYQNVSHTPNTVEYKDFKDGIQNHLVWSIKKECYFVRPINDVVVHLIRVSDCDKP
jgi:hypothetical protein